MTMIEYLTTGELFLMRKRPGIKELDSFLDVPTEGYKAPSNKKTILSTVLLVIIIVALVYILL